MIGRALDVNPSTPQPEGVGLPSIQALRQAQSQEFNRWAQADRTGRQGLTLHFDRLSVLNSPKEAALLYPTLKIISAPPDRSTQKSLSWPEEKGNRRGWIDHFLP